MGYLLFTKLRSVPAGLRRLVAAVQRSRRQNSTADCRHPGVAAVRTRASLGVEHCSRPAATTEAATSQAVYIRAYGTSVTACTEGGYIFHAGGSLAGAGYCRQCHRRPAILLLQLWQGCQACVKIAAQRPPRLAQFNAR